MIFTNISKVTVYTVTEMYKMMDGSTKIGATVSFYNRETAFAHAMKHSEEYLVDCVIESYTRDSLTKKLSLMGVLKNMFYKIVCCFN